MRDRRARWVQLTAAHVPLFPVLTVNDVRDLAYGTYQLYLAPSYIQDSTLLIHDAEEEEDDDDNEERTFEIDERTNEAGFIRIRLSSRFRNAATHEIWIHSNEEYGNNPENENEDGPEDAEDENQNRPILCYYCTCKSGARTLGACSHVVSAIWYLGYARHEENVR